MSKAARKRKAAERAKISEGLLEDSLLDEKSFQWRVSAGGYRWEHAETANPVLASAGEGGKEPRVYNPLEVGGLFELFAQLESTQDDYRGFANKYGLLFMGLVTKGIRPTSDGDHETWNMWRTAHEAMRRTVGLWKWVDAGVVSQHLRSGRGPFAEFRTEPGAIGWHLDNPSDPSKWVASFASKETEPEKAAMQLLQKWINAGLEEGARLRVLRHPDRDKYLLHILPITLSGCMWWQFARTLTGKVTYGKCRVCDQLLERGEDAFRVTREFCSPRCKQKDHRARVKQVKELKAKGMKVAEIAKQLGKEPGVITNWLTKKK